MLWRMRASINRAFGVPQRQPRLLSTVDPRSSMLMKERQFPFERIVMNIDLRRRSDEVLNRLTQLRDSL